MAKYERSFPGSISSFLPYFHDNIMGSISAVSRRTARPTRRGAHGVWVYERYSMFGGKS